MSLPVNNKGKGKSGPKTQTGGAAGSKFIAKPGKAATAGKSKIVKTGGSRGS